MAIFHPHPDENEHPVQIHNPDKPSDESTWHDSNKVATFTPGSPSPFEHQEYNAPDINHSAERPFHPTPGLRTSVGVVIKEPDGRVWLHSPTNGFGGVRSSFPKGRHEGGELQHTAAREAHEETGMNIRITGHLGDYDRSTTRTRYYTAERVGGSPSSMGWESQAMHLVPIHDLQNHLNHPTDFQIAKDIQAHHHMQKIVKNLK